MARIIGLSLLLMPVAWTSGCVNLYDTKWVSVGADYWLPSISGDVTLGEGILSNTTIDIEDVLDLEDEATVNVHAALQLASVTLEASYFELDYSGSNSITRSFNFGGQTFVVGTTVGSNVDILFAGAKAKIGLVKLGPVAMGAIVGVNYVGLETDLRESTGTIKPVKETLETPFPVIGAVVTVNQDISDWSTVFGDVEASGLYIDAFDIEGGFFDLTVRAGIRFIDVIKVGAGYRLIDLELRDSNDDFEWNLSLGGPFVFLELVF